MSSRSFWAELASSRGDLVGIILGKSIVLFIMYEVYPVLLSWCILCLNYLYQKGFHAFNMQFRNVPNPKKSLLLISYNQSSLVTWNFDTVDSIWIQEKWYWRRYES